MKVSGYNYSPSILNDRVHGFKNLSPEARHAIRDILDLIWISENMSLKEDSTIISYIGFTKKQWVRVRQEITSLSNKFIKLESGLWTSPWLDKQKKESENIEKNNPEIIKSYDYLENLSSESFDFEDDGVDNEYHISYEELKKQSDGKRAKNKNNSSVGIKGRTELLNKSLENHFKNSKMFGRE